TSSAACSCAAAFTTAATSTIATEGRFGLREERGMHVGQQSPLFLGPPPAKRLAQRVTVHAGAADILVGDDLVLNAVLRHVHHGLGLFRRQAVIGAQVFQD